MLLTSSDKYQNINSIQKNFLSRLKMEIVFLDFLSKLTLKISPSTV